MNGMRIWQLKSFYDLLEIHRDATAAQVAAAYRLQMKAWHPDRFSESQKAEVTERSQAIQQAYDTLSDPDERKRYDRMLMPELTELQAFEKPAQQNPATWKRMAAWMKDENVGTPFLRKMAFQAGDMQERRLQPSEKQLKYMHEAWILACDEGFDPEGTDDE